MHRESRELQIKSRPPLSCPPPATLLASRKDVLVRNVPGHIAECGCWRGGTALVAAAALEAYDVAYDGAAAFDHWRDADSAGTAALAPPAPGTWVYFADSFAGLPPVDRERFPADGARARTTSKCSRYER